MFDGIEEIDFKDPTKSPANVGRNKKFMLENKEFRNTRNRSTSPFGEDRKVFDDDDYPEDY